MAACGNRSSFWLAPVVALLGVLAPDVGVPAHAQTRPLAVVGQVGGVSDAIAVAPPHAFAGVGPRVVVFDVGDTAGPRQIGESPVLPGVVADLGLIGNHAVALVRSPRRGPGRLVVLDVAEPGAPRVVAELEVAYNHRFGVAGDRVYLTGGSTGLQIVDVADPRAPRIVATHAALVGSDIAFEGAGPVGALSGGGLRLVDLADPARPVVLGSVPDIAARAVAVGGDHAFLVGQGLTVVDIADPARPRQVAAADFPLPRDASDVVVVGGTAYVGLSRYDVDYAPDGFGRVLVVDVADPARPRNRGVVALPADEVRLAVAGGAAFVAAGHDGVAVVDVGAPDAPRVAGRHLTLPGAESVVRIDDHVFVAEGPSWAVTGGPSLAAWSVADPTRLRKVGQTPLGDRFGFRPLTVLGDHVLAGDGDGYRVIDASSPAGMRTVAAVALDDYLPGITVANGLVYLANKLNVRVWDLASPAAPREVGRLRQDAVAIDVAAAGGRAYVAICGGCFTRRPGPDRLQVFDVRDPTLPVALGSVDYTLDNGSFATVAALGDDRALVGGQWLVDARDRTRPRIEGVLRPTELTTRMHVHGTRLFTLSGTCLRMFDVSNPARPRNVASLAVPDVGSRSVLAADDAHVYAAVGSAGLYAVRYGDGAEAFDADCPASGYQALEWRTGWVYLPAASKAGR